MASEAYERKIRIVTAIAAVFLITIPITAIKVIRSVQQTGKIQQQPEDTIDEDESWTCANSQKIDSLYLCDGIYHCKDGSDEDYLLCRDIPCSGFKCTYGGCVAESKKCNGIQDCVDSSDEYHPDCFVRNVTAKCKVDEFACDNGECINSYYVCDGMKTCSDESDETVAVCGSIECNKRFFKCKYGACIDKNKQCNGERDCIDNSDELGCPAVPDERKPPRSDYPCQLNKTIKGTPYLHKLNVKIQGSSVENSDTVRYVCDNKFIQLAKCENGTWIGDIRCEDFSTNQCPKTTRRPIKTNRRPTTTTTTTRTTRGVRTTQGLSITKNMFNKKYEIPLEIEATTANNNYRYRG